MASTTFSGPVTSQNGFIGNVTGSVTGNVSGNVTLPVATVAAAGTNQSTAAAITAGFTYVTGADDAKGVRLPAAVAGTVVIVKVGPGADLKVYPATGDKINDGTADAAITVVDDVCFMIIAKDATDWYTLPLLPS
jgi:hypothetical protein